MEAYVSGSCFVEKAKDVFSEPMTPLEVLTVDGVKNILDSGGSNVAGLIEGELSFKPLYIRENILSILGSENEEKPIEQDVALVDYVPARTREEDKEASNDACDLFSKRRYKEGIEKCLELPLVKALVILFDVLNGCPRDRLDDVSECIYKFMSAYSDEDLFQCLLEERSLSIRMLSRLLTFRDRVVDPNLVSEICLKSLKNNKYSIVSDCDACLSMGINYPGDGSWKDLQKNYLSSALDDIDSLNVHPMMFACGIVNDCFHCGLDDLAGEYLQRIESMERDCDGVAELSSVYFKQGNKDRAYECFSESYQFALSDETSSSNILEWTILPLSRDSEYFEDTINIISLLQKRGVSNQRLLRLKCLTEKKMNEHLAN